jgi:hypothetical protein
MIVQRIGGEEFRFYVSSDNRDVEHLVDLASNGFDGECSCEHYCFNKIEIEVRSCKHIMKARRFWLFNLLRSVGFTCSYEELEYAIDKVFGAGSSIKAALARSLKGKKGHSVEEQEDKPYIEE